MKSTANSFLLRSRTHKFHECLALHWGEQSVPPDLGSPQCFLGSGVERWCSRPRASFQSKTKQHGLTGPCQVVQAGPGPGIGTDACERVTLWHEAKCQGLGATLCSAKSRRGRDET